MARDVMYLVVWERKGEMAKYCGHFFSQGSAIETAVLQSYADTPHNVVIYHVNHDGIVLERSVYRRGEPLAIEGL